VVLVATAGRPAVATIRRAVEAADDGTVAVVALLRIHGSAWGFPNPGLMPTKNEKADAQRVVEATIASVKRAGGRADGQITATRNGAKVVAAAARRRHARLVLIERIPPTSKVRATIEGDLAASVRRRLRRPGVAVEAVERAAPRPAAAGR
jgi:hypothetical protein